MLNKIILNFFAIFLSYSFCSNLYAVDNTLVDGGNDGGNAVGGCSVNWPSGIQNSDADGEIKFKKDGKLFSDTDSILQTSNLDIGNNKNSCGSGNCSSSNSLVDKIDFGDFKETSANNEIEKKNGSSFSLGIDGTNEYKEIKMDKGAGTLSDSGVYSEYFIKKLEIEEGGKIILNADTDYWIEEFILKKNVVLEVVGSGTARVYVKKSFRVERDSLINSPSEGTAGDASKLFIYAYDKFEVKPDDSTVSAIVYAKGDLKIKKSTDFFGSLASEDKIEIEGNVTYEPDAVSSLNIPGICGATSTLELYAYFTLDEASWDGSAGEVVDEVTNVTSAKALSTSSGVESISDGKVCNAATIPANSSTSPSYAIDTGVDIDSVIGNAGTISFWYRSDNAWANGGDRALFDASTTDNDKFFFLFLQNNGKLRFSHEDSSDKGFQVETTNSSGFSASTWQHIAVTWDLTSNSYHIYINGVDQALSNIEDEGLSSTLGNSGTLYIGDNRSSYYPDGTPDSGNGDFDEIRIYKGTQSAIDIATDIAATHVCPVVVMVEPIAYFALDEFTLDGTSGEVVDTQGNFTNAKALGTSNFVEPNEEGKICYGVDIPSNNSSSSPYAIDTGIDVDQSIGSAGTINFWFLSNTDWNSGKDRMLFDASTTTDNKYFYLMLRSNGKLRFGIEDSSDKDVRYSSSVLNYASNSWHHIAVTWDLSSDEYKIYADGVLLLLTEEQVVSTGSSIGNLGTLYFGDNRSTYHPEGSNNSADGRFDEIRIYNTELSKALIIEDMNATHTCPENPNAGADPIAFNCVSNGQDALTGKLFTRIAGQAFSLDIIALKDTDSDDVGDAVEELFVNDIDRIVTFELVDTSNGAACASQMPLTPAASQNISFTEGDLGAITLSSLIVSKAYKKVGCRITDGGGDAVVTSCSTDQFAIRPPQFILETPALNNTGFGSGTTAKVDSAFTLAVTAIAGYAGIPSIETDSIEAHVDAVTVGKLNGVFSAATDTDGTATGEGFSYSEVGNFRFLQNAIVDENFTNIDQPGDCTDDFSNVEVSGKVGCKFTNNAVTDWVGRFTPDHFTMEVDDVGVLENACGSFTYLGQGTGYATAPKIKVKAERLSSTGSTTAEDIKMDNYTGNYQKLSVSSLNMPNITIDGTATTVLGNPVGVTWNPQLTDSYGLTDNLDGTHTFELKGDVYTFLKTSELVGSFDSDIDHQVTSVIDSDGVETLSASTLEFSPGAINIRNGRLKFFPTVGSELIDLPVVLATEYYDAANSSFVSNPDDACTVLSGVNLFDVDAADALAVTDTCLWDSAAISGDYACSIAGDAADQFSASADFNINLKAPGAGKTGPLMIQAIPVDNWLNFNWNGTGDIAPQAVVIFGINAENRDSNIIHRREQR